MTTNTVQGYSPLDQYLMGFRPPDQVPDTFLVTDYPSSISPLWHPKPEIPFDGERRNVSINDIIQVEGRRTPDSTVAQRRFRFAFILVVAQGSQPSADNLTQIDTYRQQFEVFYDQVASSNNAVADTSLKRSMKLSLYPNAGVVAGGSRDRDPYARSAAIERPHRAVPSAQRQRATARLTRDSGRRPPV